MADLTTASAAEREPVDTVTARPAPVVITEQEVRFATAAAAGLRAVAAPARRRYRPVRHDFLERSLMAREMRRL